MGVVRVRVYTTHGGEPLNAIIARLEEPVPLLEELGRMLAAELEAQIKPHSPGKFGTGTLASGLSEVALYRKMGTVGENWAVGIGNPAILTDWRQKAPPGTIAAFLRWVFNENEARSEKRAREKRRRGLLTAKEAAVAEAKRKAKAARAQIKKEKIERRATNLAEFLKTVEQLAKTETPSERAYAKLEKLRDVFAAQNKSLSKMGRLAAVFAKWRVYKLGKFKSGAPRVFSEILAELFTKQSWGARKRYSFEKHAREIEKYLMGARKTFPGYKFEIPKPPKPVKPPKPLKTPKPKKPPKVKTMKVPKRKKAPKPKKATK